MMEPQPAAVYQRKRRPRRGVFILPSLFTGGTLVCGYVALMSTLRATAAESSGDPSWVGFDVAAKAIGLAIVWDIFDGRIARLTQAASDFGREFDSLADIIAFGIAPALLAFAWGVRSVDQAVGPLALQHLRTLGYLVTLAFVVCGAARLARFNISSTHASSDRRYFVGLPIPGAAAVIAAVVHFEKSPLIDWRLAVLWLVLVGVLAFLMISTVRYHTFKTFDLRRQRPFVVMILIVLVVYLIWAYSEWILLALASMYAAAGPVLRVVSHLRHHPPSAPGGSHREEVPAS